jgi:hypothetical protein
MRSSCHPKSMKPRLLDHIIDGDLPAIYHQFPSFKKHLDKLVTTASKGCPCIYGQYLVNRKGIALTPSDFWECCGA